MSILRQSRNPFKKLKIVFGGRFGILLNIIVKCQSDPKELQIEKVKDRKPPEGKNQTNAQKIIAWREKLMPGTEYKVKDLLEGTGLNDNQLQKLKKSNKVIAEIFTKDKTEKKGYYKVS